MNIDPDYYYYIYNVGNDHPIDICDDAALIGTWSRDDDRALSQQWEVRPVTGDYYRIVSRESDLAITDMAKQETTDNGQYITGSQLQLMPIDETDNRQLWRFMPAGDNWAIENKATHLAWNNSHGDSADGNPVISWTNNSDNATKTTRQWYLQQSDETISSVIAAQQDNNPNYRILYDPHTNQLRLQMDNGQSSVVNDIAIYDLNGRKIDTQCTMFNIQSKNSPSIYLLRWTINGHTYSRKIRLSKP